MQRIIKLILAQGWLVVVRDGDLDFVAEADQTTTFGCRFETGQ